MSKIGLSSDSNFNVRLATNFDSKQIASLVSEWLSFDNKGRVLSIRRSIRHEEIFVATEIKDRKSLVGFNHGIIHVDVIDGGNKLFLTAFYVKPQFRRKGLGSKMLGLIIDKAIKKHKIAGVEVSTIRKDAVRFYKEKFGFFQFKGDIGEVFLSLDITERAKSAER